MAEFVPIEAEEEQASSFVPIAADDEFVPIAVEETVSPTQESTTQEIAEGIASGILAIPQGLGELGAAGIDYFYDTDYSTDVTNFFEGIREAGGIDPEGTAGEIAEVVAQFVVPGLGAAGMASKLSRIANLGTVARRTAQIGAAGVTDTVVATDGVTTLGDFFEGGPTQTVDTIGLRGRELAAARLENKLKVGLEAAGATAVLPEALKAVGIGGKVVTKAAAPVLSPVARQLVKGGKALGRKVNEIAERDDLVGDSVNGMLSVFRSRGNLPQDVFEVRSSITGKVEAEIGEAARYLKSVQDDLDKVFKKAETIMVEGTPLNRSEVMNRLYGYLTKDPDFVRNANELGIPLESMLPDFMRTPAQQMRSQVDRLSNAIRNSDYLATREADDVVNAINDNIGSYMRRKYKIFEDANFTRTDEFAQARQEAFDFFKANPRAAENLYGDLFDGPLPADFFTGIGRSQRVTDRAANDLIDAFTQRYANRGRRRIRFTGEGQSRIAKDKINEGLFASRQVNNQALRKLLGEVKDPQEAFITTVADMAEFRATDDYFKYIRELVDQGDNFVSAERYAQLPAVMKEGYEQLGKGFGSIEGIYVPRRIYNDLTRLTVGDAGTMGNVMRSVYSGFLRTKGATQYVKTVLSPVTQVRNVSSAALFATAQGNVGGGANLFESVATVLGNITKRGTEARAAYYQNLQRLGVVGTQTQVQEMDRLIKEGLGFTQRADADIMGIPVGQRVGNVFTRSKVGSFLSGASTKARDLYQGGDDIWKIYNFEFERSKMLQAFGGSVEQAEAALGRSLDEYAADIVKNTVPNYERVPEFIKGIRKLPVGNFIAFPAEILRTSANTLGQALKELASDNRAIQEIGMRRLMGFTSTAVVAPAALQKMAMDLTGVSQEQIDAARESGAPWQKNSRLIPTSVDKDGNLAGYIDYSYTNPYDYLQRPALAILNAVNKGEDLGKPGSEVASEAAIGAIAEMFEPFAGESIITEKLLDVTTRKGVTQTGAKVYRDEDTPGDKAYKSFVHVADALVPGGAPFQLKGMTKETQEPGIEAGRFARSFMADSVDPAGNERRVGQEILRAFTGVSEIEVKPENILMYKGYEYTRGIRSASQIFNTAVSTRSTLDPENAISTFREANEARFRVMRDMYRTVQNMRRLGMSDAQIRREMRRNKVGDIPELMRGVFAPMKVSSEIRKRARENDNRLPIPELNSIRREFRGRRLDEPLQPEVQEAPAFTPVEVEPTAAAPAPTPAAPGPRAFTPAPVQPAAVPAPAPDTSLLGSNPIDILKNLQIFQRQQ